MADQTFTSGQILTAAQMSTLQANSGLVPITPTSVTGTGVTLSGNVVTVTSSATNVSVNGVFTTAFTNYCAIMTGLGTTNLNCDLRFRASGTDLATGVYSYAILGWYGSTSNSSGAAGTTSMSTFPAFGNGRFSSNKIDFFSPFTTETWKTANTNTSYNTDIIGMVVRNGAYSANSSTQFDGFTIVNPGTLTAKITVYGYR